MGYDGAKKWMSDVESAGLKGEYEEPRKCRPGRRRRKKNKKGGESTEVSKAGEGDEVTGRSSELRLYERGERGKSKGGKESNEEEIKRWNGLQCM